MRCSSAILAYILVRSLKVWICATLKQSDHFAAVLLFILCRAQPLFPKIPAHFESGASSRLPETISSFNTVRTSWDLKIIGASVSSLACEAIAPTYVAVILRFLNYCNSVSRCRLVAARVLISLENSSCSPDGSSASSAF